MEKYLETLEKAIQATRIADHIVYITFPVIMDKRLLLKGLENIYSAVTSLVNSILQYDYLYKRVNLSQDPKQNFEIFVNKCAKRFNFSEGEINEIVEIISLFQKHKKSPMEFLRSDRIIILSEDLLFRSLDILELKRYLNLTKLLIEKTKFVFRA